MELKKFAILPAAIVLGLAFAPAALAGPPGGGPDHGKGQPDPKPPSPPNKVPTPPSPPKGGGGSNMGGGNSHDVDNSISCRIGNRKVYVASFRQCRELKLSLGYGHGGGHGVGHGGNQGGGIIVDGSFGYGGQGYYQPQRVIRYVAMPSRAAQMQMNKRARKAARRAAAAGGYGYGEGAMIGYGNGVMVGGYGNNVVINGDVYAGNQVVVRKKRKGKKARRAYVQQPVMDYGYDYDGSVMVKGGGY